MPFIDQVNEFESQPITVEEFEANEFDLSPNDVETFEAGFEYALTPLGPSGNIIDIQYAALGAQGFTGHINDRILAWLQANGAVSGNINDAWHEMLEAQGIAPTFSINDGWFELLGTLGFTGSINDRAKQFWSDGGTFTPPAPPNTIIYAMGSSGLEVWRTDVSPYVLDNTICPFLGTQAYNVSASRTGNRLAVVSRGLTRAIYLYDTSTNPYTLLNTISLAYDVDVLVMAPNGQQLVYGASNGVPDFIALDISNPASPVPYVVLAATSINLGQCVYNQSGDRLLFTAIGNTGYFVFDTSTLPPTQVHFTSGAYVVTAENSLHSYAMFEFENQNDLYAFRLSNNSFLGIVDGTLNSRAFLTSPNGLFAADQKNTGIKIRNTTSTNVTNWPYRTIKAGDEIPSGDISAVNCFAFSRDSNLLALFQDSSAGDRRIVFDLTTSPIERVASFDTEPNKDFRDITIVES